MRVIYKKKSNVVFWLSVLITSYFYCLPLGRGSIAGITSDFRLFDFIYAFIAWKYIFSDFRDFKKRVEAISYAKHAYAFIIFVAIGVLITFVHSGPITTLVAAVRFYRLVGFWTVGLILIAYVQDLRELRMLFVVFFLNCLVQAGIASLQTAGYLESFWPDYWLTMYQESHAVATLAPHHKHIGTIMMVGIALAMIVLRVGEKMWLRVSAMMLIGLALFTILGAKSRTGMGGIIIFLALSLLIRRRGFSKKILAVALSVAFLIYFFDEAVNEQVLNTYEKQISLAARHDNVVIGNLDSRISLWEKIPHYLEKNRHLIITGTGFQNMSNFFPMNGAHNNFMHVLLELGIIGFVVYLLWLYHLHGAIRNVSRNSHINTGKIFGQEIHALFIAILTTMLIGETLYAQRAMMTLAGQLNIIFAMGTHPLWFNRNLQKFANARSNLIKNIRHPIRHVSLYRS